MSAKQSSRFSRVAEGIYRYKTGGFYLRRKIAGKPSWVKLQSSDLQAARREARAIIAEGTSVRRSAAKRSVREFISEAFDDLTANTAEGTRKNRIAHRKLLLASWPGNNGADMPISQAQSSDVKKCLDTACAGKSASYSNSLRHLLFIAFKKARAAHAIGTIPDSDIDQSKSAWAWSKVRSHRGPLPTVEQWRAVVATIRTQKLSDTSEESADVVEAMGLLGLGQAELAAMCWQDIDMPNQVITCRRIKTGEQFFVPMQPTAVELFERRQPITGQHPANRVFSVRDPKKSIAHACSDLNFPNFTARSFRKMFITQALRAGVNPKVIADIQGHRDGGRLILQTYSDVINANERQNAAKKIAGVFG